MELFLFVVIVYMLMKSRNILSTIVMFFTFIFFVEVVLVDLFFGATFSKKSELFESLHIVTYCVTCFAMVFWFFNHNIKDPTIRCATFKKYKNIDWLSCGFLTCVFIYLFYFNFIIYGGNYHLISQNKSPLIEYLMVFMIINIVLSRGRFLVLIPFLFIALLYGVSGERLRMFMHFFVFYLMFRNSISLLKRFDFKLLLFAALFLGMGIHLLRSGWGGFDLVQNGSKIHISHFGELTVSSIYLIDFSNTLTFIEKIKFFIGTIIGNVVPSSLLSTSFDIKRSLIEQQRIPGGAWLPVWFYAIGGYPLVILFSLFFGLFIRYVQKNVALFVGSNMKYNMSSVYYIMFLVTCNAWLMYSPYQVFKFPLYAVILLVFFYFFIPLKKHSN